MSEELIENLKKQYPIEDVNPYGKCVVVPAQTLTSEQEETLKRSGLNVILQAFQGRSCCLIPLEKLCDKQAFQQAREWTKAEIDTLLRMRREDATFREIAKQLNRNVETVKAKYYRLTSKTESENTQKQSFPAKNNNKALVIETLKGAILMLEQNYNHCSMLLLQEAIKMLQES